MPHRASRSGVLAAAGGARRRGRSLARAAAAGARTAERAGALAGERAEGRAGTVTDPVTNGKKQYCDIRCCNATIIRWTMKPIRLKLEVSLMYDLPLLPEGRRSNNSSRTWARTMAAVTQQLFKQSPRPLDQSTLASGPWTREKTNKNTLNLMLLYSVNIF